MDSTQRASLYHLMEKWVRAHPQPHEPTLAFLGKTYSPKEILEEVGSGTEFGEYFGNLMYEMAQRFEFSVETVMNRAIQANEKYYQAQVRGSIWHLYWYWLRRLYFWLLSYWHTGNRISKGNWKEPRGPAAT